MVKTFIACALAFLVLVPDLSGQINDRNNDPNSAKHLPDRADHLPVHTYRLMNDGTNPKQQKASAVQMIIERDGSDRAIRLALLQGAG